MSAVSSCRQIPPPEAPRATAGTRPECQKAPYYAFEEPISLNLATLLPQMITAGVSAFKIEGRQRSRAYVQTVVAAFRKAIDDCVAGKPPALTDLLALTEGQKQTEGPFKTKKWR